MHPRKCLVFLAVVRETHHLVCATCEESIKRMSIKLIDSVKKRCLGSDSGNIKPLKSVHLFGSERVLGGGAVSADSSGKVAKRAEDDYFLRFLTGARDEFGLGIMHYTLAGVDGGGDSNEIYLLATSHKHNCSRPNPSSKSRFFTVIFPVSRTPGVGVYIYRRKCD